MARVPHVFLKESIQGRDILIEAFRQYFQNDHSDAADVIHARERISKQDNISLDDMVRVQVSFNIALLPNTVPTAFWTLFNIFSRASLLQEIRKELEDMAVSREGDECYIDVAALKIKCPLLLSTFEETQRTRTLHANSRQVMEETVLDGKYWLKKGSYVQIPTAPLHSHRDAWGDDTAEFDPRRFMPERMATYSGKGQLPISYSFLAWGTAPTLCPARQFASTEILVFIALLVLQVDLEQVLPGGRSGEWKAPGLQTNQMAVILPPDGRVEVKVRLRKGGEGNWKLKMGESKTRVPLASG
ncbi:hypothetical protein ABW19_dt0206282 [Dactylella cylindrospora]|nr:hypothetical protein ABW19_dt0206282 [Dactylella cylindrospora]